MGKRIAGIGLICAMLVMAASAAYAGSTTSYPASVTVAGADGVAPVAVRVTGKGTQTGDWGTTPQTSFNFDPLKLTTGTDAAGKPFSALLAGHFYAIDLGYTFNGGAAITKIKVEFTGDTKPAGQTAGLGDKGLVTLVKKSIVNGVEQADVLLASPNKLLLKNAATREVNLSEVSGGWLRLYLGLATGDPAAGEPSGAVPFTPGDLKGTYSGTLKITSL